ncbi:cell division protein FtsK [Micromonospora chalcea]|uniref:cell division protein FtsK n=1 Tax=Micromonospora chalcea TaxID=1874 RepID=UPI0037FA0C7D
MTAGAIDQGGALVPGFNVEIDREEGAAIAAAPAPVDPAPERRTLYATVSATRDAERRPIVPAWLRSRQDAANVSRWAAGYLAHSTAYHLTRCPKYAAKALYWSPVGAWQTLAAVWRWTLDREAVPFQRAAVNAEDYATYRDATERRARRIRQRAFLAVLPALVVITAAALVGITLAPSWAIWGALVALVAVLGWVGSPADRPLLDVAVVAPRVRRLSAEVVSRAIVATGAAKAPEEVAYPVPIMRDGPGWRATVDLPYGRTAGEVVERREKLASGLDLPLGQVWPEGVPGDSTRRLVIWVGDEDLSKARQPAWPLLRSGTVDLFSPFPFGTSNRNEPITLPLMFANMIIGSVPRIGKTFSLRLALLGAALDPTAEIHAADLKGTGDLDALAPVAHTLVVGDDQDEVLTLLAALRQVHADMRRRVKQIRSLPREICPESKVTRALANDRGLRLHPVVVGIDECQIAFEHPEHGEEIESICTDLVKRGPAAGIILLLATQRPDAKSIPKGIADNAVIRFAMKVMEWRVSDMILGSGMHKAGWSATTFTRSDLGIGILAGASRERDAEITKTYYVDAVKAETVVARARAAREAYGNVTGMAAGIAPETAARVDLLDDVRQVIYVGEAKVWSETIVERLAVLRPDTYGKWTPEALATGLKAYGIETRQLNIKGPDGRRANRRGIELGHVLAAIERRAISR